MFKIKEFLKSKSITITKFAKDICLSRNTTMSYISMYEKSETIPKEKYKYMFDFLFTDTNKFDFNYFCMTHDIKRFSFFTRDELYMMQRIFIEASSKIVLNDKYNEKTVGLIENLFKEIIGEYTNRIYNKESR